MAPKNKQPVTVKLTDDEVIAIVEGLNGYQCRSLRDTSDGAVSLPQLRSIVARFDEIMVVKLAELRTEYLAARSRELGMLQAPAWNSDAIDIARRDARTAALGRATLLGHVSLVQGNSYECSRCGASGGANEDLVGAIFHLRCGTTAALGATLKPAMCAACETRRERGHRRVHEGPRGRAERLAQMGLRVGRRQSRHVHAFSLTINHNTTKEHTPCRPILSPPIPPTKPAPIASRGSLRSHACRR